MLSSPSRIACDKKEVRMMTVESASPNVGIFGYHYWQASASFAQKTGLRRLLPLETRGETASCPQRLLV
jgi:hypothetical protein